jgi:hypothetical protein
MNKFTRLLGLSAILCGCAAPTGKPLAAGVSLPCVMTGESATVTFEYDGLDVPFCCEKCYAAFDGLSSDEKAGKVAMVKK